MYGTFLLLPWTRAAFLNASSRAIVENAVWVLGNIAGDGAVPRDEVLRYGGLEAVLACAASELRRLGYYPFALSPPVTAERTSGGGRKRSRGASAAAAGGELEPQGAVPRSPISGERPDATGTGSSGSPLGVMGTGVTSPLGVMALE